MKEKITKTTSFLRAVLALARKDQFKTAVVLGSGLGTFAEVIEDPFEIPYSAIPYFPKPTVQGHAGSLIFGKVNGENIVAMNGRFHYYEGNSFETATFPIRVFKELGVENLILSAAVGSVKEELEPGTILIVSDYIKFFDSGPLRGPNLDEQGVRFPDMSNVFDKEYRKIVREIAKSQGCKFAEGVYAFMPGPQYETPAEVRMLNILGADIVGMSTVPEAMVANHCGIKTIALGCITNMASGILDQPLNHEEVLEVGKKVSGQFKDLVSEIITKIS